jgi:hypothetical protein
MPELDGNNVPHCESTLLANRDVGVRYFAAARNSQRSGDLNQVAVRAADAV